MDEGFEVALRLERHRLRQRFVHLLAVKVQRSLAASSPREGALVFPGFAAKVAFYMNPKFVLGQKFLAIEQVDYPAENRCAPDGLGMLNQSVRPFAVGLSNFDPRAPGLAARFRLVLVQRKFKLQRGDGDPAGSQVALLAIAAERVCVAQAVARARCVRYPRPQRLY